MDEFPSNAYTGKPESKPSDNSKALPVVKGKASIKKKTKGEKFKEGFFMKDLSTIKDYIIFEVILPGSKRLAAEMAHSMVDMLLYGERGSYKHSDSGSGRIRRYSDEVRSYDKIYDDRRPSRGNGQTRASRGVGLYSVNNVEFEDRWDAEQVIKKLRETIEEYGLVSVATYYEFCGLESDFPDQKYGWYDIVQPRIVTEVDGTVVLYLPKPQAL